MPKEKESNLFTVKDVEFYYTSTSRAVKQLNTDNKPPMTDHPLELHSFEIKIVVPEATFKKLKKKFKGAKNLPNAREYSPEEFAERLSPDSVVPDTDVVLIKFSQACLRGPASGRMDTRPITQIGICGGTTDRNGLAINADTNIGNGTKGHFQFTPVETKFGLYLYPTALCITELVEYKPKNSSYDAAAFGMEESAETEEEEEENAEADFESDDIPF